jgi:hypothetical protein
MSSRDLSERETQTQIRQVEASQSEGRRPEIALPIKHLLPVIISEHTKTPNRLQVDLKASKGEKKKLLSENGLLILMKKFFSHLVKERISSKEINILTDLSFQRGC